jgi:Glycosyl hydrolases family 16
MRPAVHASAEDWPVNATDSSASRPPSRRPRWLRFGYLAIVSVIVLASAVVVSILRTADTPASHWQLAFDDDFDSAASLQGWTLYDASAPNSNSGTGWWSASHVSVANGRLTIAGYPDETPTGATRIVTGGAGAFQHPQIYGKWLARVRFDACDQVKYAVLLWPASGNWPAAGEIDFAEDEGGSRGRTTASVVFKNPRAGRVFAARSQSIAPARPMTQWHTVGVEWTPTAVRFSLDGRVWGQPVTKYLPSSPMALVVQTEAVAPATSGLQLRCDASVDQVQQYRYRP